MQISNFRCTFALIFTNYVIIMRKFLSIISILAFSASLNAQSLSTGIQYIGAAAQQNAAKKQQAEAKGEKVDLKVRFQLNLDVTGRARWGATPSLVIENEKIGGNTAIMGGPAVNVDLGVRFNDSYFVGVGSQFGANFGKLNTSIEEKKGKNYSLLAIDMSIPIYGVFKVYIPSKLNISPYFDLGVGGYLKNWYQINSKLISQRGEELSKLELPELSLDGSQLKYRAEKGGFYMHAALGLDINRFNIAAGYELTTAEVDANTKLYHNLFVKVGFRIGG